jgi:hypothetical protein
MEAAMTNQTLTRTRYEFPFFIVFPDDGNPAQRPLQASARDFGYEIDEHELAEELIAPLPTGLLIPTLPDVDPDDFEGIYRCFLS